MSKAKNEADATTNRVNVALASKRRRLLSWLPSNESAEVPPDVKTQQQLDEENEAMFRPEIDELGLGGRKETEDGIARAKNTSYDKFLGQMLGKKGLKAHKAGKLAASKNSSMHQAPKAQVPVKQANVEESEDENEGRAATLQSKRPAKRKHRRSHDGPAHPATIDDNDASDDEAQGSSKGGDRPPSRNQARMKKTGGTYLDQILSEKARKRKKQ